MRAFVKALPVRVKIYIVILILALAAHLFEVEIWHRATLGGRAARLRVGMSQPEIERIMGSPPSGAGAGKLSWSGGGWSVTVTTVEGKLITDPILQPTRPPFWRLTLDWIKEHIGW
jgi:hypothetical protein